GVSGPFQLSGSTRAFTARPAQGIRSMEEMMIAIASGNAYVNVHSQANPGGEIRGQLCPAKGSDNQFNAIATWTPIPQYQPVRGPSGPRTGAPLSARSGPGRAH